MKILENKRKRVEDDIQYTDLVGVSFKIRQNTPIKDYYIVTEDTIMRPDLISYIAYGVSYHADIIMKFNAISNPFSINIGDIILIPDIQVTQLGLNTPPNYDKKLEKLNLTKNNDNKLPTIDPNRLKRLEKIAKKYKNGTKKVRSPNRLVNNDKNISKKDGLLYFK